MEAEWIRQCEIWLDQDWFCKYCGFFLPGNPPPVEYKYIDWRGVCTMCDTPLYAWIIIHPPSRKLLKMSEKNRKAKGYSFHMGID